MNLNKIAKMSTQNGQISIQNSEEKTKTETGTTKQVQKDPIDNHTKTEDLKIAAKESSKSDNENAPNIEVTDDEELKKNITISVDTDNAKSDGNGITLHEFEKKDGVENGKLDVSNKVLQCFIISLVIYLYYLS